MSLNHVVTNQVEHGSATPVPQKGINGSACVTLRSSEFKISAYDVDLTMNDLGVPLTLASDVALGLGSISVTNNGATTEAVRVAFGTSAANAQANLTIVAGAATTGYLVPAYADKGTLSHVILGVPALATHVAVGNTISGKTNTVSVAQGV